jgi:diaminopropionate ammonia-lyase
MTHALLSAGGWRACRNPSSTPAAEPYGPHRSSILDQAGFAAAERVICRWPGYAATPLRSLPALAASLGVAALHYKDESERFGLKSFKALGGAYAVCRVLARAIAQRTGTQDVSAE